jgi:hypothetical protein
MVSSIKEIVVVSAVAFKEHCFISFPKVGKKHVSVCDFF